MSPETSAPALYSTNILEEDNFTKSGKTSAGTFNI